MGNIAKKEDQNTDVALLDLSSFDEDAGLGIPTGGEADFAIPFLQIAQKGSPQVDPTDGKYLEGLAVGDIFNSVSLEFGKVFTVVPVYYERFFMEWEPRDGSPKAPVARHEVGSDIVNKALARPKGPKGEIYSGVDNNTLSDTRYHYVLVVREDGSFYPALIGLSSTGLTVSRRWNSLMKGCITPSGKTMPSFSRKYNFKSIPKSNKHGKWSLPDFTYGDYVRGTTDPIYLAAKNFFNDISAGNVKVDDSGLSNSSEAEYTDLGDVEDHGVI